MPIHNCLYKALLTLFLFVSSVIVYADRDPQVKYLGIDQGLSNNAVTCVYQDAKGFMWFGTYDGLNRYDGYGFITYRNIIGDPRSIPFNNIGGIRADNQNNLWVSGLKGIGILDPVTGKFSIPSYLPCEGRETMKIRENVHCLQWIPEGYMLAGCHNNGLLVFDGKSHAGHQVPLKSLSSRQGNYDVFSIEYDPLDRQVWVFIQGKGLYRYALASGTLSLVNNSIRNAFSLKVDKNGRLWMGTDTGLVWLDKVNNIYKGGYLPQASRVVNIDVDEANNLCLGTDGAGLWQLAAGAAVASPLLSSSGAPLVNSNAVYSIYHDRDGRKWIGTLRGGVNVIEPGRSSFATITYDPPGQKNIINNFILSFCEDKDHNVWVGTDGAGLRYWDRKKNSFTSYVNNPSDPQSISSNFITGILRDDQDQIWASTWFDGICRLDRRTGKFRHFTCYNPETNAEERHIWTIQEDRQNRIWANATNEGGLYLFNKRIEKFELFDSQVQNLQALMEDREGRMWGGNYSSLIRIDREHKQHQVFPIGYTIRCLHEDNKGQFWVGTQEGGLLLFDRATGQYRRYTTEDGLPGNTILRILEDSHGNLWMSTYNGLSELQYSGGKFRNFTTSDGLQSMQFSFNAALALSTGELLFGGIKGFNLFQPDSVQRIRKMPDIYLTQVKIQNEPVHGDSKWATRSVAGEIRELKVPFNQAMLSLDYTALAYDGTDKINYAYCLAGWDKGWNYSNGSRTANYSRIREGDYTFKIRVSQANGIWSDEKDLLHIIILPPWYRTWWAYISYISLLGTLIFLYVQYSRSKLRMRYEVRLAQLETEKEKELIERKLSFFTYITHEFRNPLTLIINPIKDLLAKTDRGEGMECLPSVHRNAQRLLGLVDQLLLFRKVESGSDELKPMQVNIVQLCKEVFLCFVEGARVKKIHYSFESSRDEMPIYLDKEKVEIVLYNLLSNALKYTPDGGKITLTIREEDTGVSIRVEDNGLGIPEEVGDQVFDKFYQIRRSEITSVSGFGIGLYLVRQFVEAHKGKISYHSRKGEGTCFSLQFLKGKEHLSGFVMGETPTGLSPLVREMAEERPEEEEKDAVAHTATLVSDSRSILVIDDDPQIVSYICQIFEKHFRLFRAYSGEEGVQLARERHPDLIISDLHMEGISGIEVCEIIKSDPTLGRTPVILLTASASANNKLDGVRHGADDYITKPFDSELLIARVTALLDSQTRVEKSIYNTIVQGGNTSLVSAEDAAFLERIVAIVENHLEEDDFSIKKLSYEIGMSHSAVYQKLKDLSGQSLNGFIRHIRLKKAAELFITTHYNVNEVALQVGIGDGKYFREQFHKQFGLNPSDYIKRYRRAFSAKYHLNKDEFVR